MEGKEKMAQDRKGVQEEGEMVKENGVWDLMKI